MTISVPHLLVVPVVLPLATAMLMLLLGNQRTTIKSIINVGATLAGLLVAVAILLRVDADPAGGIGVYLAANWEAPFGIMLVADRLTALMLVLTSAVGLASAVYSMAGWGRAGVYFHPLFQVQLMGLNGAFLTGDLFNLFVFFEVALAASYGLHLHGSGRTRVKSGLHYIAVNLLASALFLVGLAVLYGVTGTLSMADVAARLPLIAEADRGLLHVGVAILAVAFLAKAAIWPLNFWLVPAYQAASAPVAALFALMTKLGIYALLRLWTLFFSADAGLSAHFGADIFLYGGLATMVFGIIGLMSTLRLGRVAGFSIILSSGTLLATIGTGGVAATAAALFYLVSATLAASALFLLVELIERAGAGGRTLLPDLEPEPGEDTNLDDDEMPLIGRAIPMSLALLGIGFMACTLLIAGLPPLSGFIAKLNLLMALVSPVAAGASGTVSAASWVLFALLLAGGLVATVVLAKAGTRHFWTSGDRPVPQVKIVEAIPIMMLILGCVWLTVRAEQVTRYTDATARALVAPAPYIDSVFAVPPIPGPTRPAPGEEGTP